MTHFRSEPLAAAHQLDAFDSGRPELDVWLRDHARRAESRRRARTFVWHRGDGQALAYFTLAPHLLEREEPTDGEGHWLPLRIPAVLLSRLALSRSLQSEDLDGALLADALRRATRAGARTGAQFVVADALDDDAAAFYRAHGFWAVPDAGRRLLRKTTSITADLRSARQTL